MNGTARQSVNTTVVMVFHLEEHMQRTINVSENYACMRDGQKQRTRNSREDFIQILFEHCTIIIVQLNRVA